MSDFFTMGGERRRRLLSLSARQTYGICLAAVILFAFCFSYVALVRSGDAGPRQSDFLAYYAGAQMVTHHQAQQLYELNPIGGREATMVRPLRVRNGVLPFVYPPFFALLLEPFAALPYVPAFWTWLIINALLFGATLFGLCRLAGLSRRAEIFAWVGFASFLPAFVALAQGQTSIFLLAVATATALALLQGYYVLAGLFFPLLLVKPQYVVPFLLVLFLRRCWVSLAVSAGVSTVLVLVPSWLFGVGTNRAYVDALFRAGTWHHQFGYGATWNHSFAGFAQLLSSYPVSTGLTVALDAAALLFLAHAARLTNDTTLLMSLAAVVALLISPHVLVHDLVLLVLPVGLALRGRTLGPPNLGVTLLAGYCMILAGTRLVSIVPLQLSVIAVVGLGVWLYIAAIRPVNAGQTLRTLPSRPRQGAPIVLP